MHDATFTLVADSPGFSKYDLVLKGEFADVYELKPEYRQFLNGQDVKPLPVDRSLIRVSNVANTTNLAKAENSRRISVLLTFTMLGMVAGALFLLKFNGKSKKKNGGEGNLDFINSDFEDAQGARNSAVSFASSEVQTGLVLKKTSLDAIDTNNFDVLADTKDKSFVDARFAYSLAAMRDKRKNTATS